MQNTNYHRSQWVALAREETMRKMLIVGFLTAGMTLALSPMAFSQGTGGGTGPSPSPGTSPLPQGQPGFAAGGGGAPIGHRQPTAQDVPRDESKTIDAVDKLDKELDRKLGICRGC
jgi:hypothetical protein